MKKAIPIFLFLIIIPMTFSVEAGWGVPVKKDWGGSLRDGYRELGKKLSVKNIERAPAYYTKEFKKGADYYAEKIEEKIKGVSKDVLLEKPKHLTLIGGGDYTGRPVYYVNGVDTDYVKGIKNAIVLAYYLDRPVYLLHNPTQGLPIDAEQTIYDRGWPLGVSSSWEIIKDKFNNLDSLFSGNVLGGIIQANQTTRQLSHILYHAKERITLVTHSQGTLIARNAIFTVGSILRKKDQMKNDVYWAALGIVMGNSEILLRPEATDIFAHVEDPIPGILGFRSLERYDTDEHGVCESYFTRLYNRHDDPKKKDFKLRMGDERKKSDKYLDDDYNCDPSKIGSSVSVNVSYVSSSSTEDSLIDKVHDLYQKLWNRNATEEEVFEAIQINDFSKVEELIQARFNALLVILIN